MQSRAEMEDGDKGGNGSLSLSSSLPLCDQERKKERLLKCEMRKKSEAFHSKGDSFSFLVVWMPELIS